MSRSFDQQLFDYMTQHANDGILLDTNVLLLLLAAGFHPALVGGSRLQQYTLIDAELLAQYVTLFSHVFTTTHVLTEVSNLIADMVKGKLQTQFFEWLYPRFFSSESHALAGVTVPSSEIDPRLFARCRLTDSTLAACAKAGRLLLTDDTDLYIATVSQGANAINFSHMREAAGLL